MHLDCLHPSDLSRRNTTHAQAHHLDQLPLGADLGRRGWVHQALSIRVAESRKDRAEVASIVRERHYLRRRATPPKTLVLSYLASLGGENAAAMAQIALLPCHYGGLLPALGLHQAEVLQLVRSWRADDLTPDTTPDLMPEVLRRVVKRLPADWSERKCQNLAARPKLLLSWADPAMGHDGNLYTGAGAVPLGGRSKLLFGWALDPELKLPLRQFAARARA